MIKRYQVELYKQECAFLRMGLQSVYLSSRHYGPGADSAYLWPSNAIYRNLDTNQSTVFCSRKECLFGIA